MTKVLLDAGQLAGESRYSGIGTYVRGLLGGLAGQDGVEVVALCPPATPLPGGGARRVGLGRRFGQGRPAVYEHEVLRSVELRLWPHDVFHNPNPHAPRFPTRPWVQTLHDVIPLLSDDPGMAALRRRFEAFGPRYARADAVIAVSSFAADQGVRHLGIDPRRITVVYHGVDPSFSPGDPAPGDSRPYLTSVSEYSPRKGFASACEIAARVAEAGLPHELRLAGRVPPWAADRFEAELRSARRPDRVRVLGFVADLAPLLRGALAHLVTSSHEGFGLTIAEAMACGTPVVAFANSATPEIVGAGGILVPDGDVAAAAGAVVSLARSPARRRELSEAALESSRRFDWDRSARAHAEIYSAVAGSGQPPAAKR